MSSTQRATVPQTTRADDELLTMQEVADVVRVPVCDPALLAPPRHRSTQLPHRPQRPLLAHGGLRLARRPGQWRPPERRLTSCPLPTWRQYLTVSTGARTSSASSLVLRLLS
jgi:hypothetical protein